MMPNGAVPAQVLALTPADAIDDKHIEAEDKSSDETEVTAIEHGHSGPDFCASKDSVAPFPDGGLDAYRTVVAGTLTLFSTFGVSISFGVFQAELKRDLLRTYNASQISWIGSAMMTFAFLCALPAGRAFDLGYYRWQLAVGSLLFTFAIFMLSLATEYYQVFLSYSVGMGVGLGLVFASTVSCVGSYFSTYKRTLMCGIVAAGPALAGCIFPIMMNNLFPRLGFANTVRTVGAVCGFLLLSANFLVVPRELPRKQVPVFRLLRRFLSQPTMWLVCLGGALVMLGCFIPMFYIQVFAQANGASPSVIKYGLAIMNGSAVIARVVAGIIADRFGVINTAVPTAFCIGVLSFAMLGATSTASAVTFDILYGLASGAWITLSAPAFMSLAESVSEFGVRSGTGFIFVAVAVLLGSPVAGQLLIAADGRYWAPCTYAGTSALLGSVLLAILRTRLAREKGWRV